MVSNIRNVKKLVSISYRILNSSSSLSDESLKELDEKEPEFNEEAGTPDMGNVTGEFNFKGETDKEPKDEYQENEKT